MSKDILLQAAKEGSKGNNEKPKDGQESVKPGHKLYVINEQVKPGHKLYVHNYGVHPKYKLSTKGKDSKKQKDK